MIPTKTTDIAEKIFKLDRNPLITHQWVAPESQTVWHVTDSRAERRHPPMPETRGVEVAVLQCNVDEGSTLANPAALAELAAGSIPLLPARADAA
jgi:hypothetical protein